MDKIKKILIASSDSNLKNILHFCFDGWGYEVYLQDSSRGYDVEVIKRISPNVIVIDIQSASKKQLDICRLLKENFTTAFIPVIALINKRQLRTHLLSLKQGVDDYLIKPPDPLDLRIRIEMSIKRAQHSIYASSLTGLPGGKILEDVLAERVSKGVPFSFGYIDIDNFKSFNDVYGYQKGDRVLVQAAHMIFSALRKHGNNDDFISHIGGDDFAFISTSGKYEQICNSFIQMFDTIMPFHYTYEHRKQGFVVARDRTRKVRKIDLMSVSIAVVNKDSHSNFKNVIAINEKIVEMKSYLKTISGSKFMADRRNTKFAEHKIPWVNKRNDGQGAYKPLGQILLEKNTISYEQLDEALGIHWKRGVILGEVLKELGFLDEEKLQKALGFQKDKIEVSKV